MEHQGRQKVYVDHLGRIWLGWPCSDIAAEELIKQDRVHEMKLLGFVATVIHSEDPSAKILSEGRPAPPPPPTLTPKSPPIEELHKATDRMVILGDNGWIRRVGGEIIGITIDGFRDVMDCERCRMMENGYCEYCLLDHIAIKGADLNQEEENSDGKEETAGDGGGQASPSPVDDGSPDQGPGSPGCGETQAQEIPEEQRVAEEEEGLEQGSMNVEHPNQRVERMMKEAEKAHEEAIEDLPKLMTAERLEIMGTQWVRFLERNGHFDSVQNFLSFLYQIKTGLSCREQQITEMEHWTERYPKTDAAMTNPPHGKHVRSRRCSIRLSPVKDGEIVIDKIYDADGIDVDSPRMEVQVGGLRLNYHDEIVRLIEAVDFLRRWYEGMEEEV